MTPFWFYLFFLFSLSSGTRIKMLTERTELVLNEGESMELECRFFVSDMDNFNLFDNPISWKKVQLAEEFQINMMSNILQPFAKLLRFNVLYHFHNFTHHFTLIVSNVTVGDSANYTCIIQGPKNVVFASTEHGVSIRDQIFRMDLHLEPSDTSLQHQLRHPTITSATNDPPKNITTPAFYFFDNRIASGITCTSYGGYPAPGMSMLLGSKDITRHFLPVSVKLQVLGERGFRRMIFVSSFSSESLILNSSNDGELLTCHSFVPGLESVNITRIINVRYGPLITCRDTLAYEGETNVRLLCEVKAKPEVTSLFWVVDINKTATTGGRTGHEFWNLVRVKQDGSLEVQLHIKKVTGEHFRKYILVSENSISAKSANVALFRRLNHRSTTRLANEKWNFHQMQDSRNYFLRYFSKSVSIPLMGPFKMLTFFKIMRQFCMENR